MKSVWLFVAVFCMATAGSLLSQVLNGQSPATPRPDGFVFCSDHNNEKPVPLYGRCQKRQIGSLNCGEKVTVVARNGDVLRIIPASERAPRFVDAAAISRQPDKFVPFDNDSGVPDRGPIDCSAAIERRPWVDGFMVCAPGQNSVPAYLSQCSHSSSTSLACGEKVTVRARRGDMLQISTATNLQAHVALASSVSQRPDKFVPFDDASGVVDEGAHDCGNLPDRSITAPHAIFVPEPEYTDQARKKKINGTVVVSLTVTVDGTTRDIKVVKGLGYGLDEKAVEAVSRWKFSPALKDGQPIEKEINAEVSFHLY
jgi:TonB family protein